MALTRLWQRWCDYWFAPGGRISAAVLRIAIATTLLWMLWRIAGEMGSPQRYFRHGIWMLYPGQPSAAVLGAIMTVAWLSTIALLLGLWTRAAHAVSAISTMALAAYAVSGEATWSHGDVPPILASLALLGTRSGDALSIDAWWRARRGRSITTGADYQLSVRLVQLAVAAVFAFSGWEKLKSGGLSLGWALSDSLRHHLLAWYDGPGSPRTPVANWLLGAAWRYQLAACLNLVSQLAPALAAIFVRRPWLRAIAGVLWCSEVIGLGLVMNLWNLHWLPLGAAFIDWDALAARIRARPRPVDPPVRSRGRLAFVTGFVVFFALQALWLNQRLHVYPFSAFPLFAAVRAKRPYDRHQTYEFVGGRLEAIAAGDDPAVLAWLTTRASFRAVWRERDPREIARTLANVLGDAQAISPRAGITGMRLWLSIFQAPAYPAPARLDRIDIAVLGELDDGAFRSALGTLLPDGKTWIAPPDAPALAGMELFAIRDDNPEPVAVAATANATGFVLAAPLRGNPVYLIGRAPTARSWILAYRSRRGY
jgi:uncharacterized membrane protein YphA (DoxX/SURF4 family)